MLLFRATCTSVEKVGNPGLLISIRYNTVLPIIRPDTPPKAFPLTAQAGRRILPAPAGNAAGSRTMPTASDASSSRRPWVVRCRSAIEPARVDPEMAPWIASRSVHQVT